MRLLIDDYILSILISLEMTSTFRKESSSKPNDGIALLPHSISFASIEDAKSEALTIEI